MVVGKNPKSSMLSALIIKDSQKNIFPDFFKRHCEKTGTCLKEQTPVNSTDLISQNQKRCTIPAVSS